MFFLCLYSLLTYAPSSSTFFIADVAPIVKNHYDPLVHAVWAWETRGSFDLMSYNVKEEATGPLQIRPCRLEHYNRLTGKEYILNDMYNFEIAREVFLYFAKGKSFEQAAKDWNGSGPMTIDYWKGVTTYL